MISADPARMPAMSSDGEMPEQVGFHLHDIVHVGLVNASPRDVAMVARQLGLIHAAAAAEPDIVIEFVDRITVSPQMHLLGADDAGYTDDTFLLMRGKHKARVKVQIPFHDIGRRCRIVCERGARSVPLLIPILNLTALSNGFVPLHASAFTYNGTGVLVTGWAKGGKTEALLAFAANGAEYVGDEWVYLSSDGRRMYGVPQPIRLWDWHLKELPQYRRLVRRRDRARLRTLGVFVRLVDRYESVRRWRRSPGGGILHRTNALLKRQLNVQVPPEKLFQRGLGSLVGIPEKVFLVGNHEDRKITVRPIAPQEVAQRMVFSLQEERMKLVSYYLKFRFAFPRVTNELIARAEELERAMLLEALKGQETFAVYHPYPVSVPRLFDAMSPYCG